MTHRCHHLPVLHGSFPFLHPPFQVLPMYEPHISPSLQCPTLGVLEGRPWVSSRGGRLLCPHPTSPGPAHDLAIFLGRQLEGLHDSQDLTWLSPHHHCCPGVLGARPPPLSNLSTRTEPSPGHGSHLLVCFKNMYLIYTRSLVRSAQLVQTTAGT